MSERNKKLTTLHVYMAQKKLLSTTQHFLIEKQRSEINK